MMKRIVKVFLKWLPLGATIFFLCGFVCLVVQQNYRLSLNDPQIQMAEDTVRATELIGGVDDAMQTLSPKMYTGDGVHSLAPFVIAYDDSLRAISSMGSFEDNKGNTFIPPKGVFEYASKYGEHRFTWQPESNLRIATILIPYSYIHYDRAFGTTTVSGFILAGRNMREIEAREDELKYVTLLALLGTWVVSFGVCFVTDFLV